MSVIPTKRQIEVLEVLSQGYTTSVVASKLYISTQTVISHKKKLDEKLDARNTVQMIVRVLSMGMICLVLMSSSVHLMGQELIADYPLEANLIDVTGNNSEFQSFGNQTDPPQLSAEGLCTNGIYYYNPSGHDLRSPLLNGFNPLSFTVELDFKIEELTVEYPEPVFMMGANYRFIGLYTAADGAVGVKYNNSTIIWSDATIESNRWYKGKITYHKGDMTLEIDDIVILQQNIGGLNTNFNHLITSNDYSNASSFYGCWKNIKIYSQNSELDPDCSITCPDTEMYPDFCALMEFFSDNNGLLWNGYSGWKNGYGGSNCNYCEWNGVICDSSNRVISLNLSGIEQITNITESIYSLDSLEYLSFNNCAITGDIPGPLMDMTNLEYLNLGFNRFITGPIPEDIGNLQQLKFLSLDVNQLTGEIPSGLYDLVNLEELNIGANQIEGTISEEVISLQNLSKFQMYNNQLTGALPESLFNLPKIKYIWLKDNSLTGVIPDVFTDSSTIESLILHGNSLNGQLPSSLSNLKSLKYLDLENNDLIGCIPLGYSVLCDVGVTGATVLLDGNNIDGFVDFESFCSGGVGSCDDLFLISPDETYVMDNGCSSLSNIIQWSFSWLETLGATKLHIQVSEEGGPILYENNLVQPSGYLKVEIDDYVPEVLLDKLFWRMRAFVDGEWQSWSSYKKLSIEAPNTDCTGCTDPLSHNYDPYAIEDSGHCISCYDGIKNGDETGVDCGGSRCYPCDPVQYCNSIFDGGNFLSLEDSLINKWYYDTNPDGIAVDPTTQKIYWTDVSTHSVFVSDLDGSNQKEIVSGILYPIDVAIHTGLQQLFITDRNDHKIYKCNVDGTGLEVIIQGRVRYPDRIIVDEDNNLLYWGTNLDGLIQSADLDGHGVETIYDHTGGINGLDYDPILERFYFTDFQQYREFGSVGWVNKDASDTLLMPNIRKPIGLAIVPGANIGYFTSQRDMHLFKVDFNSGIVTTELLLNYSGLYDVAYNDGKVYFSSWGVNIIDEWDVVDAQQRSIYSNPNIDYRSYFEIDNNMYLVSDGGDVYLFDAEYTSMPQYQYSLPKSSWEVICDQVTEQLFYTSLSDGSINKFNINTADNVIIALDTLPTGLFLDTLTDHIYWVDYREGTLKKAMLDGSSPQLVADNLQFATGIDKIDDHFYISQWFGGVIWRMNETDNVLDTLVHFENGAAYDVYASGDMLISSVNDPQSYSKIVQIDPVGGSVYDVSLLNKSATRLYRTSDSCDSCYNGIKDNGEDFVDCGVCKPCDQCENIALELSGELHDDNKLDAQYWIMSDGKVMSGVDVNLQAGTKITLNPFFEIEEGGQLILDIEDCDVPVQTRRKIQNESLILQRSSGNHLQLVDDPFRVDDNCYGAGNCNE